MGIFQQQVVETKKKKKKRQEYLLLTDFNCLQKADVLRSIEEMRIRLKQIFRNHIGVENSINPVELFEQVFGINPTYLDNYKRAYWWNILKNIMRSMRSQEECFIISRGNKFFVLQSKEELEQYRVTTNRRIEEMENMKVKAQRWVKNKKWESL